MAAGSSSAAQPRVKATWRPRTPRAETLAKSEVRRNIDPLSVKRGGDCLERRSERLGRAVSRRLRFTNSQLPADGYLRMQKVSVETQNTYAEAWETFTASGGPGLEKMPVAALDRELDRCILSRYLDGAPLAECRVLCYAARWKSGATNHDLKRSHAALQGFRACTRERIGLPNAWEATLLLVDEALKSGDAHETLAAAGLMLQLDLMARPGEMCAMTADWFFSVRQKFSPATGLLVFFPGDGGARDKAKQQDDAVGIGELRSSRSSTGSRT